MDKKSTVAIVILFTIIVIGSIVYTVFSVVNSDGLEVDRRANIIKEEMVSMEQSLDDGNMSKKEDTDKKDKDDDVTVNNTTTNNNTTVNNQNPNNINSNNNSNINTNNNSSNVGTQNQNPPVENPSVQPSVDSKPTTDVPNKDNNTNTNVDKPNKDNTSKPVEEKPVEPPKVIKTSAFYLKTDSQGYYKEGMQLKQEGTDVYIYGEIEGNLDRVYVPLLIKAPESYSDVTFYGLVGDFGTLKDWFRGEGGIPTVAVGIQHVAGNSLNVQIGWQKDEVVTYTVHFNLVSKNS